MIEKEAGSNDDAQVNEAGDINGESKKDANGNIVADTPAAKSPVASGYVPYGSKDRGARKNGKRSKSISTGYIPFGIDYPIVQNQDTVSRVVGKQFGSTYVPFGLDSKNNDTCSEIIIADCELIEFTIDESKTNDIDDCWWLLD